MILESRVSHILGEEIDITNESILYHWTFGPVMVKSSRRTIDNNTVWQISMQEEDGIRWHPPLATGEAEPSHLCLDLSEIKNYEFFPSHLHSGIKNRLAALLVMTSLHEVKLIQGLKTDIERVRARAFILSDFIASVQKHLTEENKQLETIKIKLKDSNVNASQNLDLLLETAKQTLKYFDKSNQLYSKPNNTLNVIQSSLTLLEDHIDDKMGILKTIFEHNEYLPMKYDSVAKLLITESKISLKKSVQSIIEGSNLERATEIDEPYETILIKVLNENFERIVLETRRGYEEFFQKNGEALYFITNVFDSSDAAMEAAMEAGELHIKALNASTEQLGIIKSKEVQKLGEKQKELIDARKKPEGYPIREAELEKTIEEAQTEEEKQAAEEAIKCFEKEKKENEQEASDLENEIARIETIIKSIEGVINDFEKRKTAAEKNNQEPKKFYENIAREMKKVQQGEIKKITDLFSADK